MPLLLKESHLRELLTMRDLVPLMERALADLSAGSVVQPVRTAIPVEAHGGVLFLMPAYLREQGGLGLKAVTLFPGNAVRGLPTHLATVLLIDAETGALRAVLDGRLLTEMRTGAVSAAATKHLARRDAKVLALLGAGVQARGHLEALREVRPFAELRVWTRTKEKAERFADEAARRFAVRAAAAESAEDAVRGADVVCTLTASQTPVLRGRWLGPGTHINAVGAPRPDWREMDTEAVARAQVFVDSRAAAVVEAGDLVAPLKEKTITEAHIVAEIGEVFAGRHPGRTDTSHITLFKSVGLAVEDVATAQFAYEQARARQVGDEFSLD